MKRHIARWLSALLIAALLTIPAATAEAAPEDADFAVETGAVDAPTDDAPTDDIPTDDATTDEMPAEDATVEETTKDAPAEAEDVPEAVTVPEAVDAVVAEACDIVLDDIDDDAPEAGSDELPDYEAQTGAELPEDVAGEEAAAEASAPQAEADGAVVEEAPDASAKRMEAEGEIPIDEAHFPDAGFRDYLTHGTPLGCVDQDGNGALSEAERNAVVSIQLNSATPKADVADGANALEGEDYAPYYTVQTLEGIKYFPNLADLQCSGVGLTSLDVSGNPGLRTLHCEQNSLTTLTFGKLPVLEVVNCRYNQLTALNLRGCPKVAYVTCYGNGIRKIYVSRNGRYKDNRVKYFIIVNGRQKTTTLKKQPKAYKCVVPLRGKGKINCDRKAKIAKADTPFTPTPGYELIAATKDYTKASVLIGATFQINPGAGAGYAFKSSKKKVATVDKNGIVTTAGAGNTKITFKVGRQKRTLSLTVIDPTFPTNVVLDLAVTSVKKGDVVTLTPAVPEGSDPGGFKWKTSNKKIATVKDGVVTFLRSGKVTITVTAVRGKKKDSLTFTVSN